MAGSGESLVLSISTYLATEKMNNVQKKYFVPFVVIITCTVLIYAGVNWGNVLPSKLLYQSFANWSNIPVFKNGPNRVFKTKETTSASSAVVTTPKVPRLRPVTVVTAYFNIGKFGKGSANHFFTPNMYFEWFSVFGRLNAPLVIYCDTDEFELLSYRVRESFLAITKVIRINRTSLWSWQLRPRIEAIYNQPTYPKHHPNTVNANYTCAMHSKLAVMNDTIYRNYFPAEHYIWIDIGCYREIINDQTYFSVLPPPDLQPDKVAYGVVSPNETLNISQIFRGNLFWVGGSSFIARRNAMLAYCKAYKLAVERYLAMGESNSDQQVVYALSQDSETSFRESTGWRGVQPYPNVPGCDEWFSLCYRCREI